MNVSEPLLNKARLWQRAEDLSAMTLPGQPWTRRAFSDLFLQSRVWLRQQFEAAGLEVTLDAGGNLVGRREGRNPAARPLAVRSRGCGRRTPTKGGKSELRR